MKKEIKQVVITLLTVAIIIGGGLTKISVQAVGADDYEFVQLTTVQEIEDLENRTLRLKSDGELGEIQKFGINNCNDRDGFYILCFDDKEKFLYYGGSMYDVALGKYIMKTDSISISDTDNATGSANTWPKIINYLKTQFSTKNIYLLTRKSASGGSAQAASQDLSENLSEKPSQDAAHIHGYTWVTVQEAGAQQDGIEEYRCSCGDVQERAVIPASQVLVKGLCDAVKDAPAGGTADYDSGNLYTISDYVIKKLAERTDVTVIVSFSYQGTRYKMTIPAGTDYTVLLSDSEYFYGYFYFAQQTGAVIATIS